MLLDFVFLSRTPVFHITRGSYSRSLHIYHCDDLAYVSVNCIPIKSRGREIKWTLKCNHSLHFRNQVEMGSAISSSPPSYPQNRRTAKIILDDGSLREYEHPVKVAQVLTQGFFLCLSDSINFNQHLSPLPPHYELQLDRLYFLLPLIKLKCPLLPSQMASIVVKAAAALQSKQNKHTSSRKRRGSKVMQGMGGHQIEKSDFYLLSEVQILAVESKKITSRRTNKHKQSWRSKLAPIPEAFAY